MRQLYQAHHENRESEIVVGTPERVTFGFQVAGLGTRAIAQLLDVLILSALELALGMTCIAMVSIGGDAAGTPAVLLFVFGTFAIIWGYFAISEAIWNGQTVGKRVFRLRVVSDGGAPLSVGQAIIRNLLRIVDWLPFYYGIGLIAMWSNRRMKRLGDLAAGTIVVKDSDWIGLHQLVAEPSPGEGVGAGEAELRSVDPELRRFVVAYATRRWQLSPEARMQLAAQAEGSLRSALPDEVARLGPAAVLERLADLAS